MMSNPPAATLSDDPATLYAAAEGRMAPLGAEEAVFFHAATGRSQVMTRDVAQAFGLCQPFLTLDAHVARIIQSLPALKGQDGAVRKVLGMFVANGLMHTDQQFIARFVAGEEREQAPVSGVYLLAPTQTEGLAVALDALRTHAARFALAWPVHVVDTDDHVDAQARAALVAEFAQATAADVSHVRRETAVRIVDELAQALPAHSDALRAILPPQAQGGAAMRNLVALLAAGSRHLVLDDEALLPLLRHPEFAAGLHVDTRGYAMRSFDTPEKARDVGGTLDADPLAAHLDACGLTLGDVLARQREAQLTRDSLQGVVPARVPWLRADRRVAFTGVGRLGRFALSDPSLPFQLGPVERAGLTATREAYLDNYRSPPLWAGLSSFGVGQGERLMPLAFDGSELIPCTLPGAVKAVELQVELLRLARPDAVDFDFPDALVQRVPGTGADDALGRPDTGKCLAGFAAFVAQDLQGADAATRLAVMAAKLDDLAAASDHRVETYLAEYLAYHRSSIIERMQQMMASEASPPIYWAADLRSAVESQAKALVNGETPRLQGWPSELDAAGCVARFRSELRTLAAGLQAWPAAWELARARSAIWRG